jgi:hypothetical protein
VSVSTHLTSGLKMLNSKIECMSVITGVHMLVITGVHKYMNN